MRKVQNIIKEIKNENSTLIPSEKEKQELWSLQTVKKHPLPPESIPAVLDIWRYSVNLGNPLTIGKRNGPQSFIVRFEWL